MGALSLLQLLVCRSGYPWKMASWRISRPFKVEIELWAGRPQHTSLDNWLCSSVLAFGIFCYFSEVQRDSLVSHH